MSGGGVIDLPQTCNRAPRSGNLKTTLDSQQTFASGNFAESRFAGGENNQSNATKW